MAEYLPELTEFFDMAGVDIRKPLNPEVGNRLCYLAFGTATSQTGYELDFYGFEKFISIVLYLYTDGYHENGVDIAEPCLLFEVLEN